jgi:hypothetical protein
MVCQPITDAIFVDGGNVGEDRVESSLQRFQVHVRGPNRGDGVEVRFGLRLLEAMPGQALLLFALVASVQAADAAQTGRIAGSVEDPTGGRIANAAVSLADPSTGLRRRNLTNEGDTTGSFRPCLAGRGLSRR